MRKCPKFIIARIQGKCVGGGVGIAAAADYVIAVVGADVKLSELAIGIGPFVVGPAVERKIGTAAFSAMAIDATSWRNSDWAKRKGLFSEVHETIDGMDESVERLAHHLSHSNPEAMAEMIGFPISMVDDARLVLTDELIRESLRRAKKARQGVQEPEQDD